MQLFSIAFPDQWGQIDIAGHMHWLFVCQQIAWVSGTPHAQIHVNAFSLTRGDEIQRYIQLPGKTSRRVFYAHMAVSILLPYCNLLEKNKNQLLQPSSFVFHLIVCSRAVSK